MKNKKTTFQQSVNEFEDLLLDFEKENDPQMKGVKLGQLHKQYVCIKGLIDQEISLIDKRRMQQVLNPKYEKLQELEKGFMLEVDMIFYQNQIKDFQLIAKPFYKTKGNFVEMNACFNRFFSILKSFEELKNKKPIEENLQAVQEKVLKIQKDEIMKFQQSFSKDILAFKEEQKKSENKSKQKNVINYPSSTENLSDDDYEIENNPTQRKTKKYNHSNTHSSLKGSILEDFHISAEHAEEDNQQLTMLKQKLQSDLQQRQLLLREQEEQLEIQEEIKQILGDIRIIDSMMNDVALLIEQQSEHLDITETTSKNTLITLKEAEKELNQASIQQVKYRSKLFSLQGAAIGGGVGFFMGGPIGTAVGSVIGASLGKVVGSVSSKKTS